MNELQEQTLMNDILEIKNLIKDSVGEFEKVTKMYDKTLELYQKCIKQLMKSVAEQKAEIKALKNK